MKRTIRRKMPDNSIAHVRLDPAMREAMDLMLRSLTERCPPALRPTLSDLYRLCFRYCCRNSGIFLDDCYRHVMTEATNADS